MHQDARFCISCATDDLVRFCKNVLHCNEPWVWGRFPINRGRPFVVGRCRQLLAISVDSTVSLRGWNARFCVPSLGRTTGILSMHRRRITACCDGANRQTPVVHRFSRAAAVWVTLHFTFSICTSFLHCQGDKLVAGDRIRRSNA